MTNYDSTVTLNSVTPGFESVSFTIKRFSHGLRSKIRLNLSPAFHKIRDLNEEVERIIDEAHLGDPEPAPAQMAIVEVTDAKEEGRTWTKEQLKAMERVEDIEKEIGIITATMVDPIYMRHALLAVNGLSISGVDFSRKSQNDLAAIIYEDGPEALCKEIIRAIKSEAGLTPAVKENLESPITSGAAADGQTTDTIAPIANDSTITSSETVVNTSLNG